jgi:GNAT superfamily N-acetyltransferase
MASTALTTPAPPEGLQIRRVESDRDLAAFRTVISRGFGMELEGVTRFVRADLMRDAEVECYLGILDGEPVASSTLVYSGRVAGVYNVATMPEARRRGFGEALTWHAIGRGAAYGCDMAALQASEMGRPIYERMGFRLVSPYKTFHRPGV